MAKTNKEIMDFFGEIHKEIDLLQSDITEIMNELTDEQDKKETEQLQKFLDSAYHQAEDLHNRFQDKPETEGS